MVQRWRGGGRCRGEVVEVVVQVQRWCSGAEERLLVQRWCRYRCTQVQVLRCSITEVQVQVQVQE